MSHARDTACDMPMMSGEVQSPCPSRARKREIQRDTTRKRDIDTAAQQDNEIQPAPIQQDTMAGDVWSVAWKHLHGRMSMYEGNRHDAACRNRERDMNRRALRPTALCTRKRKMQRDTTRKRDTTKYNEIQLYNETTRYSPSRYNEIQGQEMCDGMKALAWKDDGAALCTVTPYGADSHARRAVSCVLASAACESLGPCVITRFGGLTMRSLTQLGEVFTILIISFWIHTLLSPPPDIFATLSGMVSSAGGGV